MWIEKKNDDDNTQRVGAAPSSVVRGGSLQDKGGCRGEGEKNKNRRCEKKTPAPISAEGVHVHHFYFVRRDSE